MRVIETVEELRQHIEANLRGLAKRAVDMSKESRRRHDAEGDERLKDIWKREAEIELRVAKLLNDECDALLKRLTQS